MKIVDIELVRAHCNSLPEDDILLKYYTEVAEEMVVSETRRTDEELIAMGGGSYPTRIKQAVLLIVAHFYKVREAVSTINEILTPFAYAACVKPFRKFATDWKNEDNDMYNGIIKGETGLFINLDISKIDNNRQQSIGLSLKTQDISGASAEADGLVTAYDVQKELEKKQNTLVSGKSIKTFGGESLLGSGNIDAVADVKANGASIVKNGVADFGTIVKSVKVNDTDVPNLDGVVNLGSVVNKIKINDEYVPFAGDGTVNLRIGTPIGGIRVNGEVYSPLTPGGEVNLGTLGDSSLIRVEMGVVHIGTAYYPIQLDCNDLALGTSPGAVNLNGDVFVTSGELALGYTGGAIMLLSADVQANVLRITCGAKKAEIPLS